MGNYSHISRSVSCKWLSRLIRILIVKLLRFNNKKISLLLFANKICKRPGEKKDALSSTFSSFMPWNIFLFSHHENSKFSTSFFYSMCNFKFSEDVVVSFQKLHFFAETLKYLYCVNSKYLCIYRGSSLSTNSLSTNSLSTIPGVVQFEIVLKIMDSPM